ncbi:MAG TPA: alpha/beta fold hydrolase [Ramlibacter sp.]|nr:alpha/beta fold hydrolase [Ramlibacter sp.]
MSDSTPRIGYRRRGRMEPVLGPHRNAADPADVTQKVVFSFRFSRQGEGQVLVDTEARVLCVGRAARLRYLPYWLAIKPFSGLIRREILRLIKQEAEQRMQQRQLPRPRTVVQLPKLVVAPLRGFFRVSSRVWPGAAIGTFKWLLSRMPKRPLRPAEQAFLGSAERLAFTCGDVVLAGYAFGRGPTVLMVHGLLGSSANYHVMIPALVERGYRVVAVDGLNHGNSPAGSIVSEAPVRQIAEVMRQLGDLHAVICHSAGTCVTMMALLDFPAGATLKKCVYLAPYPDLESILVSFMDYFAVPERLAPPLRRWFEQIGGRPLEQQSFQACLPLHRTPQPLAGDPSSGLFLTQGLGHFRILKDPKVIERVGAFLDEGRTDH